MADFRVVLDPASGLVDQVHVRPPVPGFRILWSIGATLGPAPQEESFRIDLAGACGPRRNETLVRAAGEIVERWAVTAQEHLGPAPTYPDSGPSGAAAGPSPTFCHHRGLGELIERDAAMRGWYTCEGIVELDSAALLPELGDLRQPVESCCEQGAQLIMLSLPSRCRDLEVIMGVLVHPEPGIVACGLGCASTRRQASQTAVREACQIHDLYTEMQQAQGRPDTPTAIRDDRDRAWWWGSPPNEAALRHWLTLVRERSGSGCELEVLSWDELLESSSFVDISDLLPEPVRRTGWCAGRTESPDLVPLVMDETAAPARALTGSAPHNLPHPII